MKNRPVTLNVVDAAEMQRILRQRATPATAAAAADPKTVGAMVEMLTSTLEMGKNGLIGVALGAASKAAALAGLVTEDSESQGAKAAVTGSKITLQTLNLLRLGADASPGQMLAVAGATVLKKAALAFDLVGNDERKARVIAAWTDLAGQTVATVVAAGETGATFGLGVPILVVNGAALVLAVMRVVDVMHAAEPATAGKAPPQRLGGS